MKSLMIALLTGTLAAHVFADELAKNSCQTPIVPNSQASDTIVKLFNMRVTAYTACINQFVKEQRNLSKQLTDVAKANQAIEVAEIAQKEFNNFVTEVNMRNPDAEEESAPTTGAQPAQPQPKTGMKY